MGPLSLPMIYKIQHTTIINQSDIYTLDLKNNINVSM